MKTKQKTLGTAFIACHRVVKESMHPRMHAHEPNEQHPQWVPAKHTYLKIEQKLTHKKSEQNFFDIIIFKDRQQERHQTYHKVIRTLEGTQWV